jgi:hypothetical protein
MEEMDDEFVIAATKGNNVCGLMCVVIVKDNVVLLLPICTLQLREKVVLDGVRFLARRLRFNPNIDSAPGPRFDLVEGKRRDARLMRAPELVVF